MANMITRMGMFQKMPQITVDEFRDYWHYNHGPVASKMNGLLKYDQNHTVRPIHVEMGREEDPFWVDGYSKLYFGDLESQKNNDPAIIAALRADEPHLFAFEVLLVAEENVALAIDPDEGYVKLMAYVKRVPEIDAETFKSIWWGEHAELVKKMPGILGYTQDWVFERNNCDVNDSYKRVPLTYEEFPVDGLVEMYFRNVPEMEAAFASAEGQKMCEHAKTFIGKIGAQLTRQYRIFNALV